MMRIEITGVNAGTKPEIEKSGQFNWRNKKSTLDIQLSLLTGHNESVSSIRAAGFSFGENIINLMKAVNLFVERNNARKSKKCLGDLFGF
ncbi:MAG: hypothetical protein ACREBS_11765 [Nitrososphaerales archaeon]